MRRNYDIVQNVAKKLMISEEDKENNNAIVKEKEGTKSTIDKEDTNAECGDEDSK